MRLWLDDRRPNAKALIQKLIPHRPGGGWPIGLVTEITFRELMASASQPLLWHEVASILRAMGESGVSSVEEFERLFIEARSTSRQPGDGPQWRFYLPFAIDPQSKFRARSFTVLDRSIQIVTWRQVRRRVPIIDPDPASISERVGRRVKSIPDLFLCLTGKGRHAREAWQDVGPAFDTFRGVIEFTLNFGGWGFRSDPRPRAAIPHPPWMLAQPEEGEFEGFRFFTDEPGAVAQAMKLDERTVSILKGNLRVFSKKPPQDSTLSLIADCLRLYAQAMDTRWPHLCFLGFWQVAEAVAISEDLGGDAHKVAERLAWHSGRLRLTGSGYRYTLLQFANRRNDIVHKGIHRVGDSDVNILKTATEVGLSWLYSVSYSLPTRRHVREFYRLKDLGHTDLAAIHEAFLWVQSSRYGRPRSGRTKKGLQRR